MALSFILTDLAGTALGEIRGAENRGYRRSLSRSRSARLAVRTNNPLRDQLLLADQRRVKVYDDRAGVKALRVHGPVSAIKTARGEGSGTIEIAVADPSWTLASRLLGRSTQPVSITGDRGDAMGQIIDALNAGSTPLGTLVGDTGVRRGVIVPSATGEFGAWHWSVASTALADLGTGLDGPDWDYRPVEPTADALGVQIAALDVAPVFGALADDVSFEFATGKRNVTSYDDTLDPTTVANDVVHLPPGYPDNPTQVPMTRTDPASIALRGRRESIVTAEITTDATRAQLLDEHLNVRRAPRRIIQFTPSVDPDPAGLDLAQRRVPRPHVDYDVGTVVHFRAVEAIDVVDAAGLVTGQRDMIVVDALFRVFVIDVAVDQAGAETVTLTLVQED